MTCPFCAGVELISLSRQGQWSTSWRGCPCCGCMWNGRIDPANQLHRLAWLPACFHSAAHGEASW